MKKRIAIITGASGGFGKEFIKLMLKEDLKEIWCVARNSQKLDALKAEFGEKIVSFSLDLSEHKNIFSIKTRLENEQPEVAYLINNAAIEKFGSYEEFTPEYSNELITINCSAVASLCIICIPYMHKGDRIINLASQSSFQPVPYLNLYASSKAFVRSYTEH